MVQLIAYLFILIDSHCMPGQLFPESIWNVFPSSGQDVEFPEVLKLKIKDDALS